MTKLDFGYDNVAMHNGYRIKAEPDHDAANPFTDHDGNWPIAVRSDREKPTYYEDKVRGPSICSPFAHVTDDMIVHMQVHLATALGTTVRELLAYVEGDLDADPVDYTQDIDLLRHAFTVSLENEYDGRLFDMLAELYTVLGIPALSKTVRGYSQGDWSEVLVVATPAAQEKFGNRAPTDDDLSSTADLYGWWAFGDVYGYVIEQPIAVDEDGDVLEWEEIEDGSCWGYYGPDHNESGLAESALECVPSEAPTPEVREYA